jgi:hypothetical protein
MDSPQPADGRLLPGQHVRLRITSHQPWGLVGELVDHNGLSTTIDMLEQFGRTHPGEEVYTLFPPVGSEVEAIVEQVRRWEPAGSGIRPAAARLSLRPLDLESFTWPCDFCERPTALKPGGDGLILAAVTNDGPDSYTLIVHRTCLAENISPRNTGQRARALQLGRHPIDTT